MNSLRETSLESNPYLKINFEYYDETKELALNADTSKADLQKVASGDRIKVTASSGNNKSYGNELVGYYIHRED